MRKFVKFILFIVLIGSLVLGFFVFQKYFFHTSLDIKEMEMTLQEDHDYHYFYDKLNDKDQKTYQRIYYALKKMKESIPLEEDNVEKMKDIFNRVCYDHPEFYYVNSQFQYQESHMGLALIPHFDYTKEEIEDIDDKINQKISSFINQTKQKDSQIEQARLAYEYIIDITEYQIDSKDNQNMTSVFLNGETVCAGYARAYQYVLNQLGIKATYIMGTAKEASSQTIVGDGHAWVMVSIDSDYYYCDPTWGDVSEKSMNHPCYGYFMMSSEDMLNCYEPEVEYEKTLDHNYNYFQQQGSYLTNYDENVLSHAIQLGKKNGKRVAEIKCENESVYRTLKSKLDNSYLGYQILSQNGCWTENATYSCLDHIRLVEIYY